MGNIMVVADLLLGLLDRATMIGNLIKKAQEEGRDVTDAELEALALDDDAAKVVLQAAIDKARAEGA